MNRTRVGPLVAVVLFAGLTTSCTSADERPPAADQSATATATATAPTSAPGRSSAPPTAATPDGALSRLPATVATGLAVPWDVVPLADGSALVTLRDRAHVLRIRPGGAPVDLGAVPDVDAAGEGGLLGLALSPGFAGNRTVFLYLTAAEDNRVVRATLTGDRLAVDRDPIVSGIPKGSNHNGGRIAFGPDGFLYIATGDAGDTDNSQDRRSPGGKILRVTADGEAAPGNPFGNSVWSYGHRNVQGLAWLADGTMVASEFGQNTWDELNVIRPGGNYGWPEVEGPDGDDRFVEPVATWSTDQASPSGITVTRAAGRETVWLAALRGQSVWSVDFAGGRAEEPQRHLEGELGRVRDVATDADGRLWVLSNNTFRGNPRVGDDRIVVLDPAALLQD